MKNIYWNYNFSVPNVDAEAFMLTTKDLISVSNGSACTSSTYEPSHVIKAMTNDRISLKVQLEFHGVIWPMTSCQLMIYFQE